MASTLGWLGCFTYMTLSLIVLSSINDGITTINTHVSDSVDLYRPSFTLALAAAEPVAFGFIRDAADVIRLVDVEDLLWAHGYAGAAGVAEALVYDYCFVHCISSLNMSK